MAMGDSRIHRVATARRLKVLVTCRQMQEYLKEAGVPDSLKGVEFVLPKLNAQQFASSEVANYAKGCQVIVVGDDTIDRIFFEKAPWVRAVIKWGVGYDSIDLDACRESGVSFQNTPGVFGDDVAEMAILLMLALQRRAVNVHNSIVQGEWPKPVGRSLKGLNVGIYGFGSIGQQIHVRTLSFGMTTFTFDPFLERDEMDPQVAIVGTLSELASKSDVFIVCCPLNEVTRGSVNAQLLSSAKRGMVLVNVARGPIVVEDDLAHAIVSGTISGAGLDVFEQEPLPLDSPLRNLDNVLFSSHNSSNTAQGVNRASLEVLKIIQSFVS